MDNQFTCDMCNKSFPSAVTLGTHRNSHSFPNVGDNKELVANLRQKILDNHLTYAAAAEEIGISGATISRILNHNDVTIRPTSLKKIIVWVNKTTVSSQVINSNNNGCNCEASTLLEMFKEFCNIDSISSNEYKKRAETAEAELAKVKKTLNSIIGG